MRGTEEKIVLHTHTKHRGIKKSDEYCNTHGKHQREIFKFFFGLDIGLAACQRLDDHIGSFDAYHAIIAINTKFLKREELYF
jgi:hypothetical protein